MEQTTQPLGNKESHSRRNFILGAGAVVAAGMAASASAIELAPKDRQPSDLPKMDKAEKKLGFAIVGLGELALTQILPAFAVSASCRPVALVSGHSEKAKQVAEHYGINEKNIYSYETFDSIKDNAEIDVVYIVLPNSMHAEFTVRALNAGKHVLCEKPMAPTVGECSQMISAAKSAKRKLMIAYRLRYEPFNQKMIEFARTKKFGEMRLITADNTQDVKAPNIRLSKTLKGGPLGDVGIYCLNACRYLTGEEPLKVNAMRFQPKDDPRFAEVEDRFVFQLQFPSGILANCSAGFSTNVNRRFMAFCQNGSFGLDPAFGYSSLAAHVSTMEGEQKLAIEPANHFAAEMDHFASCIVNDTEPTTPGEEGLADMRIIEKLYQAADEGRTVLI